MTELAESPSRKQHGSYFLEWAKEMKKVLSRAVTCTTGGWRDANRKVEALACGDIDICGLGRPLRDDPHFVKKVLSGQVRRSECGLGEVKQSSKLWSDGKLDHSYIAQVSPVLSAVFVNPGSLCPVFLLYCKVNQSKPLRGVTLLSHQTLTRLMIQINCFIFAAQYTRLRNDIRPLFRLHRSHRFSNGPEITLLLSRHKSALANTEGKETPVTFGFLQASQAAGAVGRFGTTPSMNAAAAIRS